MHEDLVKLWGDIPAPRKWELIRYESGWADGEKEWVDFVKDLPPISEEVNLCTLPFFATPTVHVWLAGYVWFRLRVAIISGNSELPEECQDVFFGYCESILWGFSDGPIRCPDSSTMNEDFALLTFQQKNLLAEAMREYIDLYGGSHELIGAYRCYWQNYSRDSGYVL